MWRDESFLKEITEDKVKQEFLDDLNPLADKKLSMLKQQIRKRFPVSDNQWKCNAIKK